MYPMTQYMHMSIQIVNTYEDESVVSFIFSFNNNCSAVPVPVMNELYKHTRIYIICETNTR